jgi:MOSC domain-containing protein YiiM
VAATLRPHDYPLLVGLESIHMGPEEAGPLVSVTRVEVLAGKGVVGDRHFHEKGAKPGQALTLVEAEEVERAGLEAGQTRRQLTTRGVRLNDLVGKRFKVGEVECYGVELCEPCRHLQSMTRPGIIKDMVHRAGINADVLNDGTISVGDEVTLL